MQIKYCDVMNMKREIHMQKRSDVSMMFLKEVISVRSDKEIDMVFDRWKQQLNENADKYTPEEL